MDSMNKFQDKILFGLFAIVRLLCSLETLPYEN